MDQMEAAQLKRLNELMDTLIPSISQEDVPTALVALFTYLTENPDCAPLSTAKAGSRSLPPA